MKDMDKQQTKQFLQETGEICQKTSAILDALLEKYPELKVLTVE